MTITVYAHLADEAKKRLDKVAKKAARYNIPFSYTMSEEHPQQVDVKEFNNVEHCYEVVESFFVSAVDFDINCEQFIKSEGWTVCAMIEHGDEGNIVTGFGNYEIPAAWYTIPAKCDHCKTNRARSVTFMVKRESGEMKQVGKSCLKEYTGINPASALMFAEITNVCDDDRGYDPDFVRECRAHKMYETETILAYACDDIKKRGYRKSDSADATRDKVIEKIKTNADASAEATAKARAIMEWMLKAAEKNAAEQEELNRLAAKAYEYRPNSGYCDIVDEEAHERYLKRDRETCRAWDAVSDIQRNCFPMVKSGYAKEKHIGRLCYLPVEYDKYLERKARAEQRDADNAASTYIGKVGERITVKVKDATVISSWETVYGTTYLNKIVDIAGNILIWKSSSSSEIKPGNTLKGTVKEHSEYQGAKQTVVTRCKVER